ncbi:hypothetical protein [Streptomyces sioyaensis]|uniref:hypothetical protein n=1 Tax=Streptomyces sioyaensis TaxID=67364 RepID=UPI003D75B8A2
MPVRQVLASVTSRELAEWVAYERAYGPIDLMWTNETLAQIHELLQNLLYVQTEGGHKPHTHQRAGLLLAPKAAEPEQNENEENELIPDEFFE